MCGVAGALTAGPVGAWLLSAAADTWVVAFRLCLTGLPATLSASGSPLPPLRRRVAFRVRPERTAVAVLPRGDPLRRGDGAVPPLPPQRRVRTAVAAGGGGVACGGQG